MKKITLTIAVIALVAFFVPSSLLAVGRSANTSREGLVKTLDVYDSVTRFWSNAYKGHFYTANPAEDNYVTNNYPPYIWSREGTVFSVLSTVWCDMAPNPPGECLPVYRFWSPTYKHHFYTMNEVEMNNIIATMPEWNFEGKVYSADDYAAYPEDVPLYRFWSSTYRSHFYTTDLVEKEHIIRDMPEWQYEGVAYYVMDESLITPQ